MSLSLAPGARVCIVGGGPAGSFAALLLLKAAREAALPIQVIVYEPHDGRMGPRSCKGCAGILSAAAVRRLEGLGLGPPAEVIQSQLRTYVVHVQGHVASIEQPYAGRRILSVYRGGGPLRGMGGPVASFDRYLADCAQAAGAQVVTARVRHVRWEDERPVIYTDHGATIADLLVLATGVNSRSPLAPEFGYRPPVTEQMAQDEIIRPPTWPETMVAGFFGGRHGLMFGALTPKGRYLNVSLFSHRGEDNPVQRFYQLHADALARFFVQPPESCCGCRPFIAVEPAPVLFGNRWVAVGDAAVTRLYKDGIHAAFMTASTAIRTAVTRGIDRAAFAADYAPVCQALAADNVWGRRLFRTSEAIMTGVHWARAYVDCVRMEAGLDPARRVHSRLLWGMLTGDESYTNLARLLLRPLGWLRLARSVLRTL